MVEKISVELPQTIVNRLKDTLGVDLSGYKIDYDWTFDEDFKDGQCSNYETGDKITAFRAYKEITKDTGVDGEKELCRTYYWLTTKDKELMTMERCELESETDRGIAHFISVNGEARMVATIDDAAYRATMSMVKFVSIGECE